MIYRLKEDYNHFMRFHITPKELRSKMGNDPHLYYAKQPQSRADFWVKPDGSFYADSEDQPDVIQIPDITLWSGYLVLNEKAYHALSDKLDDCEFLPANCEGNTYHLLSLKPGADRSSAVDESNSEQIMEEGIYLGLKSLVFHESQIQDSLLFKVGFDHYYNFYCTEAFKNIIEDIGFNGLLFRTDLEGVM